MCMTYLVIAGVVVARVRGWYPGTWSQKSSRRLVSCDTPVLGCRSRLGRSIVGRLPSAVARRSVDRRTSAAVSSNGDSKMILISFTTNPSVRPLQSSTGVWQTYPKRNRWRNVWHQIKQRTFLWRNEILRSFFGS